MPMIDHVGILLLQRMQSNFVLSEARYIQEWDQRGLFLNHIAKAKRPKSNEVQDKIWLMQPEG